MSRYPDDFCQRAFDAHYGSGDHDPAMPSKKTDERVAALEAAVKGMDEDDACELHYEEIMSLGKTIKEEVEEHTEDGDDLVNPDAYSEQMAHYATIHPTAAKLIVETF